MKIYQAPIKLWLWVVSIFITIQIGIIISYNWNENEINQARNDHFFDQLNFIEEKFKGDTTNYKVIIIGTSLIGNGVLCDDEKSKDLSRDRKINIAKIWGSNDLLKKFVALGLIKRIAEIDPDLVLFQTELATINFSEKNIILDNILWLSQMNKALIRYSLPFIKNTTYDSKYRCYPKTLDRPVEMDTASFVPANRKIKQISSLGYLTNSLIQLNQLGIESIIVDIPRPIASERIVKSKQFISSTEKLFTIYKEDYNVDHWKYDGQLIYFKNCIDLAHLNYSGRTIYTNWLLAKIDRER